MNFLDVGLIGVGVAMDASAVTVSNSMAYRGMGRRRALFMCLIFALFQGIMPLIGYFAGSVFASFFTRYAKWVVFVILGFLGAHMLFEFFTRGEDAVSTCSQLTVRMILLQAVGTSIDALAVVVTFTAASVRIFPAVLIIASVTLVLTLAAYLLGRRFGRFLGSYADLIGGLILALIAIKSLF